VGSVAVIFDAVLKGEATWRSRSMSERSRI
jgi:hypothetical protein